MEDDEGYDLDDPKHSTFHERYAEAGDNARKREREEGAGPPVSANAPLSDPPVYYRMDYDAAKVDPTPPPGFDFVIVMPGKFTIWGRKVGSPYREDQKPIARAEKRGYIMGEWFSTACPDGELGTHHKSAVFAIPESEFIAAWKRGWE